MTSPLQPLDLTSRRLDFFIPIVGWFPTFVFLLYSIKIRIQEKYFESIFLASGRAENSSTLNDFFFVYREDLLFFGVLTPIVLAIIFKIFNRTIAKLISIIFITFVCTLLYANLQSWGQVGRFLTLSALVDAVSFGVSKPEIALSYISLRGLLKYLCVLGVGVTFYIFFNRLTRHRLLSKITGLLGLLGVTFTLIAVISGFSADLRNSKISQSFLVNSIKSLMPHSNSKNQYENISDGQLKEKFQRLSKTSETPELQANFGTEKKSNLLLFVLETASIDFLDTRNELPSHPVWNLLPKSRYVSGNHFSTFPASAESNLSILTGVYPPRAYYDTCLVDMGKQERIPTLIGQFNHLGVQTAAYVPFVSQVPMDKVVFEATGFQKVFYGVRHLDPRIGDADRVALFQMISDIKDWSSKKKSFAVGFYPQHGHGPWSPTLGKTIADRGHKVVMQQLDWLYEVVQQLERSGVLQNTVIVLTGDHGVRTLQEDPALKVGMIDKYSLHVPLILIAPNSQYPKGISNRPTSHVDIAAELSQLFGIKQEALIQGTPFLNKSITERRQFFMANWYYGADGYRDATQTSMYSSVLDVAFSRSDQVVSFQSKDMVDSHVGEKIRNDIDGILDLQFEWVRRFACHK